MPGRQRSCALLPCKSHACQLACCSSSRALPQVAEAQRAAERAPERRRGQRLLALQQAGHGLLRVVHGRPQPRVQPCHLLCAACRLTAPLSRCCPRRTPCNACAAHSAGAKTSTNVRCRAQGDLL